MSILRWLLAIACLSFLAGCASSPENSNALFVRAEGVGDSEAAAREQALKNAIERAYGLVVTSETSIDRGRLKDEGIISLTAGFIQRFEVVKTEKAGAARVRVTVDALVSRAALASRYVDYFQGKSERPVASDSLYYKAKTILDQRQASLRLLADLLSQYPANTFRIKTGEASVEVDGQSKIFLKLPTQIQWSEPYLQALREFAGSQASDDCSRIRQRHQHCHFNLQVFVNGWRSESYARMVFDDAKFVQQLVNRYKPVIGLRVSLLDASGRSVHRDCFRIDLSDNWGRDSNFPLVKSNDYNSVYLGNFSSLFQLTFELANPTILKSVASFQVATAASC